MWKDAVDGHFLLVPVLFSSSLLGLSLVLKTFTTVDVAHKKLKTCWHSALAVDAFFRAYPVHTRSDKSVLLIVSML